MKRSQVAIVKTHRNPGYDEIRVAVERALALIGGVDDIDLAQAYSGKHIRAER